MFAAEFFIRETSTTHSFFSATRSFLSSSTVCILHVLSVFFSSLVWPEAWLACSDLLSGEAGGSEDEEDERRGSIPNSGSRRGSKLAEILKYQVPTNGLFLFCLLLPFKGRHYRNLRLRPLLPPRSSLPPYRDYIMHICPFVGIGSSHPHPRKLVCLPPWTHGGGGSTRPRVRGWGGGGTHFGWLERKPGTLCSLSTLQLSCHAHTQI
jgi:hypothetical protein